MGSLALSLITVIGLALGAIIGNSIAKNDPLAVFGWIACGAIPGVALQCGEALFMLTLVLLLPLLAFRYYRTSRWRSWRIN